MILGAITGVPTPACLSAASNPVEAVTPPCVGWQQLCCWHSKNWIKYTSWRRFGTEWMGAERQTRGLV